MTLKEELILQILNYQKQNPPTLGHGFAHFVRVAKRCEDMAIKYNEDPMLAWAAGMLHDIYRPAVGGGQEDHETRGAEVAKELLQKTSLSKIADEVVTTILDHDKYILEGSGTKLMEILSVADKCEMSFQMGVAYTWASVRTIGGKNSPIEGSFVITFRDFAIYQVKAWKIFLATKLEKQNAIEAYLQTNKDLIAAVEGELAGQFSYSDKIVELAKMEALREKEELTKNNLSNEDILAICENFSELI